MLAVRTARVLILITLSSGAVAQNAVGPARGSVAGGVRFSPSTAPLLRPPIGIGEIPAARPARHPPGADAGGPVNPIAGPRTNSVYQEDLSIRGTESSLPPIVTASFQGIPQTNTAPPDPVVAAGPRHVMAAANYVVHISDKSGSLLKAVAARDWYANTLPQYYPKDLIVDPRVQYDHFAGRWVMLWHYISQTPALSYYLMSISEGDDPLGTWHSWALPADRNGNAPSNNWADNGCLGLDSVALYIASDQYTFGQLVFDGVKVRIIPKAQLLGHTPDTLAYFDFWNLTDPYSRRAFHVRPCIEYTYSSDFFLLEVPDYSHGAAVNLFRIANPASNPSMTVTAIPLSSWNAAPDAVQAGGGPTLDVNGSTLAGELPFRDGLIWAAHSVANPVSSQNAALRYFCVNTLTGTVVEDVTFGATGFWYIYPAIIVDKSGNLAITFSRSGETQYAGAFMTYRRAGGDMQLAPSVPLKPGRSHYRTLDAGSSRWGDYSTAALDPVDSLGIWLTAEYADIPENSWATWVTCVRLSPFTAPQGRFASDLVNCGGVNVGSKGDTTWTGFRNVGLGSLTVSAVTHGSPEFTVAVFPSLPRTLVTYDSLRIGVVLAPRSTGVFSDLLALSTNSPAEPVVRIALEGSGVTAAPAGNAILYAAGPDRTGVGQLHQLTPSGEALLIGPTDGFDIKSLAVRPRNGMLYGITTFEGATLLLTLDAKTGAPSPQRIVPLLDLSAIAFGPGDTLYGGTLSGGLYTIDRSSGNALLIGRTKGISYAGLAFHRRTDRLLATSASPFVNDTLYWIDRSTGNATQIGATGFDVRTTSISFDDRDTLFGLVDNAVIVISPSTGHGNLLGLYGVDGLRAIAIRTDTLVTGLPPSSGSERPLAFRLNQNYPNPFNPLTVVSYQLPVASEVRLSVFDILGREAAVLVNERKAPGDYHVSFDASRLASGVYLYRLVAGGFVETRKMAIIR